MKAIMCRSGSRIERDMADGFRMAGLPIDETDFEKLDDCLQGGEYLFVFTIGFNPKISGLCQDKLIPYLSWLVTWDVQNVLVAGEIKNPCNYIFCFERGLQDVLASVVGERAFHLPLAVNVDRWEKMYDEVPKTEAVDVSCLWEEKKRPYEDVNVSEISGLREYTKGYLEALLGAQERLCGCFVLENAMNETIVKEIEKSSKRPAVQTLADMATYRERVHILARMAEMVPISLYGERLPAELAPMDGCQFQQYSDTEEEKANIYKKTKINLCLTHREIRTGFSAQIFEILACGGFVLTNLQPEIPECFDVGDHLEVFTSPDEMEEKVRYYLEHEDERQRIAENGRQLVKEVHTYVMRAAVMFQTVFSGIMDGDGKEQVDG